MTIVSLKNKHNNNSRDTLENISFIGNQISYAGNGIIQYVQSVNSDIANY